MKAGAKMLWPLATFVAGFVGAKTLSRPGASVAGEGDVLIPPAANPSALIGDPTKTATEPGFGAAVARMSRVEAALARGDFESLVGGEWEGTALRAWARADPAGLWTYMEAGGWVRHDNGRIGGPLFTNWFRRDPDAAVAALPMTHKYGQWDGRMAIFGLLFDDDSALVRAVGERLDEFAPNFRPIPGEPPSRHWRNGLEVVERMLSLPESRTKAGLVEVAVGGWAERNWREARDWVANLPDSERPAMEGALFATGVPPSLLRDPEGVAWAAEFLARDENRELRVRIGRSIAGAIARDDPAAAMQWAADNLGSAALGGALGSIVSQQLKTDRAAALAIVDGLPPGGLRDQVGRSVIRALRMSDAPAAYARALGELQRGFDIGHQEWGQIGFYLGRSSPEAARQILTDLPDEVPPVLEDSTLEHLSSKDPEGTLSWAAQLGGDRGEKIATRVLSSWRVSDPVAAGRWEAAR